MNYIGRKKDEEVPFSFKYKNREYKGVASPLKTSCREGFCYELDLTLNGEFMGTIYCGNDMHWTLAECADKELVKKIGQEIELWYGAAGLSEITQNLG